MREINQAPLSARELDELIGDRDYKEFLSTRNELYRERNMAEHPPSRAEAIRLIAQHPNLLRRPLWIRGKDVLFGWKPDEYGKWAKEK